MFSTSAFRQTLILLSAMLFGAAVWGFFRIPGDNLLVVVFTFLFSALLAGTSPFTDRLRLALTFAVYSATAQFLISVLFQFPFWQIVLSSAFAYLAFSTLPDLRAGCVVMIIGYLSYFAPHDFHSAVSRSIDIFIGVIIIMLVTTLCEINSKKDVGNNFSPCSGCRALVLATQLAAGNLISQMFRLRQGAWIMLTILFITMSESSKAPAEKLALQRIFAVPAGIVLGGFLLETFCRIDYRLVYLVPFLGAIGFFFLYNCGNFFIFSLFFMLTLTVFSDWMTGPYHRFHFWDTLFSRTAASLLGALLVLTDRRTA